MTPREFVVSRGAFAVENEADVAAWRAAGASSTVAIVAFEPALRRALVTELAHHGARFATLVADGNWMAPSATFATGTVVLGRGMVMPNSAFACFALVLEDAAIGHDVILGDFVSIGARACISGYVTIGADAVVGTGAVVVNGTAAKPLTIGAGARISPGAVVTKNVPPGATLAGNPGRRVVAPSTS